MINEIAQHHVNVVVVRPPWTTPVVMNADLSPGIALMATTPPALQGHSVTIPAAALWTVGSHVVMAIARIRAIEIARIRAIETARSRRVKGPRIRGTHPVPPRRMRAAHAAHNHRRSAPALTEPVSTVASWATFSVIAPSGLRIHPPPPPQNNEGAGTGASVSAIPAPPPTA